jgi:ABC-type sugar transport system ATPase subunit
VVGIRPEDITILDHPAPGAVEFNAYSVLPSGADSTIVARLGITELTIRVMGISKIRMDDKIWLTFDPATLNLYDKERGNLITS